MVSPNPDHFRRRVGTDFDAVYENGVLRPEHALDLPNRTRVRVSIVESEDRPKLTREEWIREFARVRGEFSIDTRGWTFNRDEIHERD